MATLATNAQGWTLVRTLVEANAQQIVVIIVDISGSMNSSMEQVREFFAQLRARPPKNCLVVVIAYDDRAFRVTDAAYYFASRGGGTNFSAALRELNQLLVSMQRGDEVRATFPANATAYPIDWPVQVTAPR